MLALFLAWVSGAEAADVVAAEEIIVYGDDFARWDETRWLVQSEMILPMGVSFARDRNESFASYAFQVRAIVECSKDHKLSKKKWEVSCEIEDVGILASSQRRWRRQRDRDLVQRVLDEVDGKLTGMRVQMQVDFKGGITNIDLEGIDPRNERERAIQETLRQVVSRVMAGFHLRIPDHAQREGQWVEYNSNLMQMPSLTASKGSTTLVHVVSPYRGLQIVQTVGEGTTAVNLPVSGDGDPYGTSDPAAGADVGTTGGGGGIGAAAEIAVDAPDDGPVMLGTGTGNESDIDMTYKMSATGVAVFDKETGVMTERVWACHGVPTAGSAGGSTTQGAPFRNVGRILLLGQSDRPDVGPSRQVALPGKAIEGLDPWVDIETIPE